MTCIDPGGPPYNLSAGIHTFQISGRSKEFRIDRVHMYLSSVSNPLSTSRPQSPLVGAGPPTVVTLPAAGTDLVKGSTVTLSGTGSGTLTWSYDANSDGFIDEKEVRECPGLMKGFRSTDKDGDGQLTADEIEARIAYYKSAPTTIIQGETRVKYRGRLLEGAEITFEPESFLGEAFKSCTGTTDYGGIASIKGHDDEFPGIYLGYYRVRVSKIVNGKETIPAKYNSETTIGHEARDDMNAGFASVIVFELK